MSLFCDNVHILWTHIRIKKIGTVFFFGLIRVWVSFCVYTLKYYGFQYKRGFRRLRSQPIIFKYICIKTVAVIPIETHY